MYWKRMFLTRTFLVRNFLIMFINMIAIIRHFFYSYWICGWVLGIFIFLPHSLNVKWRARWVSRDYAREEEGEKWQWLGVISLSHRQWMPLYWGTVLDFWLVSFYISLIPSGSLIEAIWNLVFMNVLWFYKMFSFKLRLFSHFHCNYIKPTFSSWKSTILSRKNIKCKVEVVWLITNGYNSQ